MLFASFCPRVRVPALRVIPIHPDDWHLMGIYWQSQYYVDLYLPFGLRSAPFLFNQFSDALEWISQLRPTARAPHFGRFFHR